MRTVIAIAGTGAPDPELADLAERAGEAVAAGGVVVLCGGLGEARNVLVARAGGVLLAIGRGYGTLSEIAFALKDGTPVVGLRSWDLDGILVAEDPEEAARLALQLARAAAGGV